MSNRTHPRREAARKPSLAAVIYKYPSKTTERANATQAEYREALNVIPEPIGPRAIGKEIDKAIRYAF
jgi:hypothetical protein